MTRTTLILAVVSVAFVMLMAAAPAVMAGPDPLMQTQSGGDESSAGNTLSALPEPGSMVLLALGGMAMLARRRSRR